MGNFQDTIEKLLLSDTGDLNELARIAGKDPKTFYIDADFKRCDLTGQNLDQMDTRYADFSRAKLSALEQALWEARKRVHAYELDKNWLEYAASNIALAAILNVFAARAKGPDEILFIEEAVSAYRAALTVYTKDQNPDNWANIQNNFAASLAALSKHAPSEIASTALLSEAVDAYRAALTVRTKAEHPVAWAATQNNLAIALSDQAQRSEGPASTTLLSKAVNAYRAALTVYSKAEHPVAWAATQNNLGNALKNQAQRSEGPASTTLLSKAVDAFRAALTVRTKAEHPVDWAMTQNNLAIALKNQAQRSEGPASTTLLSKAVDAFRAALTVRTKAEHPVAWAMTKGNLAILEKARAQQDSCENPRAHFEAALAYVDEALTVFDPVHMAYDYGTASRLREQLLKALDD